MGCLFCKSNSASFRSVEHIIPESLGNTMHVLPKGIVCDACNNYFSRKVEKPFLENPAVRYLRFDQWLKSKRGRVPSLNGVFAPDIPALVTRYPRYDLTSVQIPEESIDEIREAAVRKLILPIGGEFPKGIIVSRFLAKVALEAMAERVSTYQGGLAYLCDETQLDDLRDHARRGRITQWPVHIRTIYPVEGKILGNDGRFEQVVHEYDFIATDKNEWFFALAIFGVEFVINLGGPEIDGYLQWLNENNQVSPLYTSKNGDVSSIPK